MKRRVGIEIVMVVVVLGMARSHAAEPTPAAEPQELISLREDYYRRLDAQLGPIIAEYDRKLDAARKPVTTWYEQELAKMEKRLVSSDVRLAALVREEVERIRCEQWNDISLEASQADVKGSLRRAGEVLNYWGDSKAEISWDTTELGPGTYEVYTTYGCQSGQGGKFKVRLGGRTLDGEAVPTKGWADFQTRLVGEVTVTARNTKIRVSTVSINNRFLWDFRRVVLKRSK